MLSTLMLNLLFVFEITHKKITEVKIKAEHASDDGAATETNNLEPITAETADKMDGKVTVTTSSSKEDKS